MMRKMMAGAFLLALTAGCGPAKQKERAVTPVAEDTTFLTGTFFLVRHAEKNPGADSTLTAAGERRAGKLYQLLKDSAIQRIYSTPFRRTMQTGDSLRIRLGIDTVTYPADSTGEALLYEISRRGDWGKRILVIGHSNTLLPLMRSLNAKPDIDSIADKDYGNLFIIRKTRKDSRYIRKRY
ncbi:histidine phosphatase family protein [Chitinophaga rhizosphaerae]|uniref:histidine phosphatase family protein n=1 Tax=Chitinophaga rhizosphaerae TaxID=1864947 RepID=UPI000F815E4D|nr:histidine phosphatase family protein [Chitinophaga rhizosphaerae]